jgi:hypothetical protein
MKMVQNAVQEGYQMTDQRELWIEGVKKMMHALTVFPDLPIPKMSSESTFVAMLYGEYPPGELLSKLVSLTNRIPGATLEFYNWTEDRSPEMDRVRIVWMFGPIRYEIDAPMIGVFAGTGRSHWVFTNAKFIGENVNTVIRPAQLDP